MSDFMIYFLYLVNLISMLNNNFVIKKIYDDKIFYNFVSYEKELYVSSNKGIYKINSTGDLLLFDNSILGPINSVFEKNNYFKVQFEKIPELHPEIFSNSVTDFAYAEDNLIVITRGKLLVYNNLLYSFNPVGSVRSISQNAIGTYGGVYINGNKLIKISYTDGQIKEFDDLIFVCYNGLLSYDNNQETLLYNNDNSIRTKGEYGNISEIYSLNNYNYLVISNNGIYKYNYKLNTFQLIYKTQNKIIPIRNKIKSRIVDRSEFHFIDNKEYISLNVNSNKTEIIENNIDYAINDILESDINGNDFYAISENQLLHLKRAKDGLKLSAQFVIKSTAHTIADYKNLIFLAGNNGLSIFDKTKQRIIENYIVDEFNSNAVYKDKTSISFGSIHGVYKIDNISDLERKLSFKDFKITEPFRYKYLGVLIFIIIILILFRKKYKKTNITDEQMINNIKRFINKNLDNATLKMIESEFQLDYTEMNNLSKEFKPAKFIKERRIELTKKMLLKGNSISEISNKTGYSETYLVKNKYKFLK